MNKLNEQELAQIIDIWYFEWKDKIVDNGLPHKLGFAKEDLKQRITWYKKIQ